MATPAINTVMAEFPDGMNLKHALPRVREEAEGLPSQINDLVAGIPNLQREVDRLRYAVGVQGKGALAGDLAQAEQQLTAAKEKLRAVRQRQQDVEAFIADAEDEVASHQREYAEKKARGLRDEADDLVAAATRKMAEALLMVERAKDKSFEADEVLGPWAGVEDPPATNHWNQVRRRAQNAVTIIFGQFGHLQLDRPVAGKIRKQLYELVQEVRGRE